MNQSDTSSKARPLVLLGAVLIGFFLGDIAAVVRWAPSLFKPSHWSGLGALVVSGLILYAAIGLYLLAFYAVLRIVFRILRLKFTPRATALLTALLAPPFLVAQDALQRKMIGQYMSPKSPAFYTSTVIIVGILIGILVLVYFLTRRLGESPAWLRRALGWRGLIAIAFVAFTIYTLVGVPRINVLGVFSDEEQQYLKAETKPVKAQNAAPGSPNFIILAIEATRRDEFKPENAPFIWQLAQENVWLSDYYVVSTATVPSVTSFFTSLYPAQHRCYSQGFVRVRRPGGSEAGAKSAATLIQPLPLLFQQNGYYTFMTTSNPNTANGEFGFEDIYYRFDAINPYQFRVPSLDPFVGYRFLMTYLSGWRVLKVLVTSPEHSWTYFEAPRLNATIERVLNEKLAGEDKRPFFLYVHYMEPHSPYYQHPHKALQVNIYSPGRRERIRDAYRGEIRAVDSAIEDLFAFLKDKGLLDNTYVFITADHGEEFYDHYDWGHGKSLYPEVVGVPGVLVLPPGRQVARRYDGVVENIDIVPTFAELAGVPIPRYVEGKSLVPLFASEAGVSAKADTAATVSGFAFCQFDDERQYWWASAITKGWQIIYREPTHAGGSSRQSLREQRKVQLFDLTKDPTALHNLHGQGLGIEKELATALDQNLERLAATALVFSGKEKEVDPKVLDQLRALGYIQ